MRVTEKDKGDIVKGEQKELFGIWYIHRLPE